MKHRILVIEPGSIRRSSLAEALSLRGFAVDTVDSGKAGVQRLNQNPPAALVTALFMEDVDGLEVVHLARSLSPDTRLVVVDNGAPTWRLAEDYLEVARQVGADICLKNPSVDQVVKSVEDLLSASRDKTIK